MARKYRLLKKELLVPKIPGIKKKHTMYRIQAVTDIPEHGVRKGDIGGYVKSRNTLSQEGSCWVAYDAYALGNVSISDNAYISDKSYVVCGWTDSSITVSGDVRLKDKAAVYIAKNNDEKGYASVIRGNAEVSGNAELKNVYLIEDNAKIYGNAEINTEATIRGNAEIYDNAVINKGATIEDGIVRGKAQIGENEKITGGIFEQEGIFVSSKRNLPELYIGEQNASAEIPLKNRSVTPLGSSKGFNSTDETSKKYDKAQKLLATFKAITDEIASYESDIVKIIKYPVMTDRTEPHTGQMAIAFKKANRLSNNPEDPDFAEALEDLELKFVAAESNALKLASTVLNEEEKKKTEKAKDLLAIAANEGSSENEKKVSFKQAFKHLEGVITVPEVAVDTFRVKIGLKELEVL